MPQMNACKSRRMTHPLSAAIVIERDCTFLFTSAAAAFAAFREQESETADTAINNQPPRRTVYFCSYSAIFDAILKLMLALQRAVTLKITPNPGVWTVAYGCARFPLF